MKKDEIKNTLKLNGILINQIIQREHDNLLNPINPNKFKREIKEFVKGFQPTQEVSSIEYSIFFYPHVRFRYCPFDIVKSIFTRFILCFPAVKELSFWNCRFSKKNFKNLLNFKSLNLNKLGFYQCNIPEVSSFCSLLKSISIKDIKLYLNNFRPKYISNIFKNLSFNKTILKIKITEKVQNKAIISAIKNFLKTNKTIKILNYGDIDVFRKLSEEDILELQEEDIIELQEIADSHPSILGLQVYESFIEPNGKSKMLKKLVHSALQSQYEKYEKLKEVPVILMGDGRTGKTSLLRNLSGKSFQKQTQSTLVLEDYQIFQVNLFNKFKPLTKYDLSVQRVKNMLDIEYFIKDEVQEKSKYNLDFEDELITRTITEKSFVEQYTTNIRSDFRTTDTFLRVYDFGGQEVFSSVHHIFMNKKAIYFVVFNMTKLNEKDLFRLKFWCESILRNTPKAPVMFIGTFLNAFLKKNETLDSVNYKINSFLSRLSGNLTIFEDEKTIFFPVDNALDSYKSRKNAIKGQLRSIKKYNSKLGNLLNPSISIKSVYVLFLDNFREEASYMTVQKFKLKAKKCNFSEEEMEEMLEIYSNEGIISYFPDLNLSERENFIFFAPSFLAQALGSFIRDETFHQLAFRTNKKVFSNYRKYIDTGIIRKDLFEVLLRQYTKKEREYILSLALHSLVLFADPREKNAFIVPELLPEGKDRNLKALKGSKKVINFVSPITIAKFVKIISLFLEDNNILESHIFKYFARFIFSVDNILDIYFVEENKIVLNYIGYEINSLLWTKIQNIVEEKNTFEQEIEEECSLSVSILLRKLG
eukprot:snap_masked-scaffold_46-processed-gene-1.21-mRNA-1 protein AED:1.00 eAED:1.00 QI:0/0/0/0/1/1/6/0/814